VALRNELEPLRASSLATIQHTHAELHVRVQKATDEFARRRRTARRWRRLALGALQHACARLSALVSASELLNDLAQVPREGPHAAPDLRSVSEAICSLGQQLAGGCYEAALYVQDTRSISVDVHVEEARTMSQELRLYRLLPPHPSAEELGAAQELVLSCPACHVPLDSLVGAALLSGLSSVGVDAPADAPGYDEAADCTPGLPPPPSVLHVPLSDGPRHGVAAVLRLARPHDLSRRFLPRGTPGRPESEDEDAEAEGEDGEDDGEDEGGGGGAASSARRGKPRGRFGPLAVLQVEAMAPLCALALSSCFATASSALNEQLTGTLGAVAERAQPTELSIATHGAGYTANDTNLINEMRQVAGAPPLLSISPHYPISSSDSVPSPVSSHPIPSLVPEPSHPIPSISSRRQASGARSHPRCSVAPLAASC
jgi:hypothetical protein